MACAQLAHEKSSGQDMSDYFDSVQKKDTLHHEEAIDRQAKENEAMQALEAKQEAAAKAQEEEHDLKKRAAKDNSATAVSSTPDAVSADPGINAPAASSSMAASHASTEALAEGSSIFSNDGTGIFGQQAHNKHGFHAVHMARDVTVKKELEDAKAIARNDLNDCAFTLC